MQSKETVILLCLYVVFSISTDFITYLVHSLLFKTDETFFQFKTVVSNCSDGKPLTGKQCALSVIQGYPLGGYSRVLIILGSINCYSNCFHCLIQSPIKQLLPEYILRS